MLKQRDQVANLTVQEKQEEQAVQEKQYQPEEIQELISKLLEDVRNINEELSEFTNSLSWDRPMIVDDEEHSFQIRLYSSKAIAPVIPTEEPEYSLSMGDEHLSTIPKTESVELIKFSVENLVPIPSEYEVTSDNESECDVHVKDESSLIFITFSNTLFDCNDDFTSSDDESLSNEDVPMENFKIYSNPLFDDEEIISNKIDPHYFNAESNLIGSLPNRDTLFDSSPKFDYLEEFSGELMSTNIINEERIKREHEEYISLMEKLLAINSFPRPLENFHANTIIDTLPIFPILVEDKEDIHFLEELLSNDSILLPKNESSDFDHHDDPSFPRPPLKPPDVEIFFDFDPDLGELISVVMNNIDELIEDECFDPGGVLILPSNWFPLTKVKWLPLMTNSFAVSGMMIMEPEVRATHGRSSLRSNGTLLFRRRSLRFRVRSGSGSGSASSKLEAREEDQSVSSYLLKMKSYLDTLVRLGYAMPNELGVSLILSSLNKDHDQFVQNYNMHSMGKMIAQLHAMLKLHEKGIPKKAETPIVLAIQEGKIQKEKKKPRGAKGKDKGKNKLAYAPNPKIPPSPKRDNPAKESVCHHCKEEVKNEALSMYIGNGICAVVKAIRGFDLILPSGLIIVLDNCHFAPSVTKGVVLISRLVNNDMHNIYPNVSSMFNVRNKRARHTLDSFYLWHCRLGHINKKCMDKLLRDGILQLTHDESLKKCKSCISGKMACKPFPHQVGRAKDLLGLIHTDVCVPFRNVSREGASYFITITDDFSRYGYVYLMKLKHEVFETFKVERTPYEIWHGKDPKLSYLRVWGCQALIKRDTPDKLDLRSIKCIFVGYPKETIGYYFYYPLENKIFVARKAEFFKNILMIQEASGSHGLLESSGSDEGIELIQEEDTQPSKNTSEIHKEVEPIEVEPQNVKVLICRSARIPQAPNRYGFYVDFEEYELGDLNEPPNYKAALSDPEFEKWLKDMNTKCNP
nr:retrotransposon protein, putative, Ty1-copia subclass [Tanacetum cinerariifolium]